MKKIRLIPILLALTLTGCLASGGQPEENNPGGNNTNEPSDNNGEEGGNVTPPDDGGQVTPPDDGGQTNPPDDGEQTNPDPVDYISKVKLNAHSDFSSYENKTFVNNKISLVTLKSVIDGDTIHVYEGNETLKIRFAFIDTPELTEEYGREASQFVQNILQEAKTIVITNHYLSSTESSIASSVEDK